MFTAHAALELYADVFRAEGALDKLRAFACENGPDF
jgi:dihydroorotase